MRVLRKAGVWVGAWMLLGAGLAWCQVPCSMPPCGSGGGSGTGSSQRSGMGQAPPSTIPSVESDGGPLNQQMENDQAKMRNNERQKQLVSDTQKLLALANELKEDVDKSNKDTLSLDVIKKADEIEKLAHSVKEKMKGS